MADGKRPKATKVNRRLEYRDAVPPGDDAGPAGVREPRQPKPSGPLTDAGALPASESPHMITLPEPRR
jgi:hypothetical protein